MCLEFQEEDTRAEYQRFVREGAELTLPLRDESFGQRRFGLFDQLRATNGQQPRAKSQ